MSIEWSHAPAGRVVRRCVLSALLLALLSGALLLPAEGWCQPRISPEQAGEVIAGIEVRGNRRANADEIRYNVQHPTGAPLDLERVSQDIKRIFRMGFFADVQVNVEERAGARFLVYYVREKPAIAGVVFRGNDKFNDDKLLELMDLRVPSILDLAKVKANEEKLRAHYVKEGFYLAEVSSEVVPRPDGDVEVHYDVREYSKVQIRQITILGNEAFPDADIKGYIFTRESSLLGFLTGAGEFKEEEFKRDLQRISAFYADNGYPDARVVDPQVKLSDDRRSMFISLRVEEGDFYTVSSVDVSGDLLLDAEVLRSKLVLTPGEKFRLSQLFGDVKVLRDIYADEGYAYVNIEPKRQRNVGDKTLAITYDINMGRKVRFGRIVIMGNQKTADKVIRRELRIDEGEIFSGTMLDLSERSVMRLGFFEKVTISTQPAGDMNYIDVQVEVTERPTGTFQVGAGFSSVESFIGTIQVSQENFLGRGQTLMAQATFSGLRQLFNIQFFEPYFFDSPWRFRATVFNFEYMFTDFTRSSWGGTLGFGYPITRDFILDLNYTIEMVDVSPGGSLGTQKRNVGSIFTGGRTSSIGATLAWDTRDNRLFPSSGFIQQVGVEVADDWLVSENEFTRFTARSRWYFPLFYDFVLKLNADFGLISNWNADGKPVPIFERFFVGGPNSVRGFERASLGPSRRISADVSDPAGALTQFHIGGDKQLIFNAEIEFPILTSVGIKGVIFADAGNAFDNDQDLSLRLDLFSDAADYDSVLRTAVGLGFRWFSPIGLLRFEWGFPLAPLSSEDSMVFEFSIGNAF